ncbi:MAG: hypothetical protein H0U19_13980 [Acidobacteria bacterium]|nr:hypothetical protein [Acidobacteriota bacterium]
MPQVVNAEVTELGLLEQTLEGLAHIAPLLAPPRQERFGKLAGHIDPPTLVGFRRCLEAPHSVALNQQKPTVPVNVPPL